MKISVVVPIQAGSAALTLRNTVMDEGLPFEVVTVSDDRIDIFDAPNTIAGVTGNRQPTLQRYIPLNDAQMSPAAALSLGVAHSHGDIIFSLASPASLSQVLSRCRGLYVEYQAGVPAETLHLPVVTTPSRGAAESELGRHEIIEDVETQPQLQSIQPGNTSTTRRAPAARKPKTLIVVPIYNQRATLEKFIYAVLAEMPWTDILLVEHNSPDGTGILCDTLAIGLGQVRVVHREAKLGAAAASVLGFRYAETHGYDLIFEMNADSSYDPHHLPRMAELAQGADLVVGSRYLRGGSLPDWTPLRRLIGHDANLITCAVLGMPGHDCTSTFRCYQAQAVASLHLDRTSTQDYIFPIEMAYALWQSGYQVREAAVTYRDRDVGAAEISPRFAVETLWWALRTRLTGSPVVADQVLDTRPLPPPEPVSTRKRLSRLALIATAVVCLLTVIAYLVAGHWLYSQWRVTVGNAGIYVQSMYEISRGHIGGFSLFAGAYIWSDAGEFIAYPLAPLYALLGINALWLIQGLSVAASEILAVWLARYYKLATWQQLAVLAVVAVNPFVIANFVTSWDFNVLFIPALLGLIALSHTTTTARRLLFIAGLTLLTCMIKDEVLVALVLWGVTAWIFRIGDRRASALIAGVAVLYFLGLEAVLNAAGTRDTQIALHYSQIGGAGGVAGVMKFAVNHPLDIASQIFSKRGYFLELAAASGGTILVDSSGIVCLLVGLMNALGGGPIGQLMAQSNLEFTLINVPFLFVSLIRLTARLRGAALSFLVILAFTVVYFGANYYPFTPAAAAAPPSEVAELNRLESWYWEQPVRPAFYGQQVTSVHFMGSRVTGVVDDSLKTVAMQAEKYHLPLLIAFDQLVTYDAVPNHMVTMIAGLLAAGDLTAVEAVTSQYLHVYYLDVPKFMGQGFQSLLPLTMSVQPWMWLSGKVTFDLAPGTYQLSRSSVAVQNATLQGLVMSVPDSASTVPVTLIGSGSLAITRQS